MAEKLWQGTLLKAILTPSERSKCIFLCPPPPPHPQSTTPLQFLVPFSPRQARLSSFLIWTHVHFHFDSSECFRSYSANSSRSLSDSSVSFPINLPTNLRQVWKSVRTNPRRDDYLRSCKKNRCMIDLNLTIKSFIAANSKINTLLCRHRN